ncbi:Protein CBG27073 [Caenorhabditis briggsae]|uniref:Uncharacterized protein n=2 Tax=Caenorhabditis briggsae TaxID=6238 RepID=A0AAE9F4N1_CAEBR|nr:Protein CBG27073 [Caenorhabditis briggsae]ULT89436.1 hypothetical protein L3Y34_008121 [Caenorhabditis briggsae]UMM35250.1 hypothetical protein L5515_007968 [Caenorhabditis briggsae]CAR99329.1 Protein CBG27073 [Caenorhabditis briggsae]
MGCIGSRVSTGNDPPSKLKKAEIELETFPEEIAHIRLRAKSVHFASHAILHFVPYQWQEELIYDTYQLDQEIATNNSNNQNH